ncbi:MAG: DUF370 domain-containing protein [Alicyclobacillus macrosporangiidus]|uniref:extracellular matrix regulator RemB n=1 Tax=Alicyclobacillus macrosporangiidus TaxID=392015 RepID=UPI0026EE7214|nr:extracellular matrix/biofilm biosynthesis regulator RemA family protein [Alicyclobacillus macrosporangiidus]MCL6598763.1 DUF370 domain-containing protein [Alicyclobacillus macrosporangiidus]
MFIHLGGDTAVRAKDIVGIFDMRGKADSANEAFLGRAAEGGRIVTVEAGPYKSFVVTVDQIYYSPISSATLKRRARQTGV